MTQQQAPNYLSYYDLEAYLFGDVHEKFVAQGWIGAFDFFSIVIWKANRAKSVTARRLLKLGSAKGMTNLDTICAHITEGVHKAASDKDRLVVLLDEWKFLLPMASAILSVFYTDRFSVYDYRVCAELGRFANLAGKPKADQVWHDYQAFIVAVNGAAPAASLRDKDRFLTGRSMARDLDEAIRYSFKG